MGRAGPRSRCICVEGRPERPTLYLPGRLPYADPDRMHYTRRLPRTQPAYPIPPGRLPYTARLPRTRPPSRPTPYPQVAYPIPPAFLAPAPASDLPYASQTTYPIPPGPPTLYPPRSPPTRSHELRTP